MTHSGLTNRIALTSQSSSRQGARIDHIILHHQAGTNSESVIRAMQSGSRQVSSNYVITNEGEAVLVVDEDLRAWTSGSSADGGKGAAFDRRSITFEIENESPVGWTVSAAAHEKVAQIVADVARRYGVPLNRDAVLGHRELWTRYRASYATACPGGLNMDAIVARAIAILGGAAYVPPVIATPVSSSPAYPEGTFNGYSIRTIQSLVGASIDGVYGPQTVAAVKAFQTSHGLAVDGLVGPLTWAKLTGGAPASTAKLAVDGAWGPATTKALQRVLGVADDGKIGPNTIRALQRRLGVGSDGILGPITRKALQRRLGVAADGVWGPATTRALQTRLNTGTL